MMTPSFFSAGPKVFGKVFEVFGPVSTPWYSVRFNSKADIEDKDIKTGMEVFYAPKKEDYTKYVFVSYLKNLKGSDASWKDDNEPPDKYVDYSDDDEEKKTRSKTRAKDRSKPSRDDKDGTEGDQLPGAKVRRDAGRGRSQHPWRDSDQHTRGENGWNNRDNSYSHGGPQPGYQRGRGGPRFCGQTFSRGVPPRHPNYPRPRAPGPFGRPVSFPSDSSYDLNGGPPADMYKDNNLMISPGRFTPTRGHMGHNQPLGNTSMASSMDGHGNEWNNMAGYPQLSGPPLMDNRLVMNNDSQTGGFSSPTHHSMFNQNSGVSQFQRPPQSVQHTAMFQSSPLPPPLTNQNQPMYSVPPPFVSPTNNSKPNNGFRQSQSFPPPFPHPPQMNRPPYHHHPPVFGGQPHFPQTPGGRQ